MLDRPEKRNALTPESLELISACAAQLEADPSCRALLLRGEGEIFCAGFDLTLCRENSDALDSMLRGLSRVVRQLRRTPKPVVIAARGAAIAGGCALLAGADLVIADQAAKLGYPVVKLGISPAVNAAAMLRAVGPRAARERLLDPELVSGREALRIGLIDRCVDIPEDVIPRAQIEAAKLAEKPPHGFAQTKRWLNEIDGSDLDAQMERGLAVSLSLVGGAEERARLSAIWKRDQA